MSSYEIISQSSEELERELIKSYEEKTGRTLKPADPDRLFLAWMQSVIESVFNKLNYIAGQNIPSLARGENLDSLGRWIYGIERPEMSSAKCNVLFRLQNVAMSTVIIPQGTRVTDSQGSLVWATTADGVINIGESEISIMCQCETPGAAGNGYVPGQINRLIDVDNVQFFLSCENTQASSGGAQVPDDSEYFDLMQKSLGGYSCAGNKGAYEYFAKSVSNQITDVKAVTLKSKRQQVLTVYSSKAFIGGDSLLPDTLKVYAADRVTQGVEGTDYSQDYSQGLLTVTFENTGVFANAPTVYIEIEEIRAGTVSIFALKENGEIADSALKTLIESACGDDNVRAQTDKVEAADAEEVSYNINLTYYMKKNSSQSSAITLEKINEAVEKYKKWQCEKFGRDIDPSQLMWILKETGIKRAVISSPSYTHLSAGENNEVPQIAKISDVVLTNGGVEDE